MLQGSEQSWYSVMYHFTVMADTDYTTIKYIYIIIVSAIVCDWFLCFAQEWKTIHEST